MTHRCQHCRHSIGDWMGRLFCTVHRRHPSGPCDQWEREPGADDAQLALPLQDARATAGTASSDNAKQARNRAKSGPGDAQRPRPYRATPEDIARYAEPAVAHAARVTPDWDADALELVRRYALTHTQFLIEDVRYEAEDAGFPTPPSARAWGAIAIRAKSAGFIANAGHGMTRSRGTSNATLVTRWRSLLAPQTSPQTATTHHHHDHQDPHENAEKAPNKTAPRPPQAQEVLSNQ